MKYNLIRTLSALAVITMQLSTINSAWALNASAVKGASTSASAKTAENAEDVTLATLTNYQVNSQSMVSSGLPAAEHFQLLKDDGVTMVIDLIPGDRLPEQQIVEALSLNYHNIQVEWEQPTLANFKQYTGFMNQANIDDDKVLTHCKLNWRGAVFTYLYRITALGESELSAKKDLLAIWQPNQTWFAFMNMVIADFNEGNNTHVATTVTPQIEPVPQ
ncbi:protein tyrosine phosphatase family protein [Alteromonas sp. 1_MG-2023]|uniref:protein tyrosine phosphatase family protein n=1 Tax=Alteromonas sp. 1_MG-2023 TaxID=3062669 RepID=UPI0026E339E2|nr:protein tyrosine phosphatase family protein [Alteromonas sp. 1_MG-2023]MDO6568371.1 protein tyrosine phosphatase family protein [Alteromonas sp. 1_MG-2023]